MPKSIFRFTFPQCGVVNHEPQLKYECYYSCYGCGLPIYSYDSGAHLLYFPYVDDWGLIYLLAIFI